MDRQLLAKLGVILLLAVNGAAYYLLWPRHEVRSQPKADVSNDEPSDRIPAQKKVEKVTHELPEHIVAVNEPLNISNPPTPSIERATFRAASPVALTANRALSAVGSAPPT